MKKTILYLLTFLSISSIAQIGYNIPSPKGQSGKVLGSNGTKYVFVPNGTGTSSVLASPNGSVTAKTSNNGFSVIGVENGNSFDVSAPDTTISIGTSNGAGTVNYLTFNNNDGVSISTFQNRKFYYNSSEVATVADYPFVTPEMFGASGNGTTNDQAALQAAVNYNGGNVEVKLTYGKNYFTATTFTTGDNVRISGNGRASIISTTANISIITIKGKNNVIDGVSFVGNSTGNSQRAIDLTGVSTFTLNYTKNLVSNCYFEYFGGAAIYVTNIIGSSSGSKHEGAINVTNSIFDGNAYGVNCDVRGEYNVFNNLTVVNSTTCGISVTGGNNYICNSKMVDNAIGGQDLSGTNDGHGGWSNNAFNHNTINFKSTATIEVLHSNNCYYGGAIQLTGSGKTKFSNCSFSMSGHNFTQTNSPVQMDNSEMVVPPSNFNLTGQKPILNNCMSGSNILCWPDRTFIPSYTLTANATFTVPYSYGIESITFVNTTANAVTGGIRIGTTNGGAEVVTAQAVGANEQVQVLPQDIKKYFFAYNGTTTLYVQAVTAWNSASVRMVVKLKQWNNF